MAAIVDVLRRPLLAGARTARGATAVIDTFRAYSAAAYAFDAGVERIVLASDTDAARGLAARIDGAVLVGEEGGVRIAGFDLGNSPGEILEAGGLVGATVVQRTSAGTVVARAALEAGAMPLYVASLVVAGATARALAGHDPVTLVAAGRFGTESMEEDEAVADYLERALSGVDPDGAAARRRAAEGEGAVDMATSSWAHPDDLDLCLRVDHFDFAMLAAAANGLVEVRSVSV